MPSLPQVSLLRVCKALKLEAEPALYKNTFVLKSEDAIQQLFRKTLQTPARKLLLKSIDVTLHQYDFTLQDIRMSYIHSILDVDTSSFSHLSSRPEHYFWKTQQRDISWQRKLDPILDNLALDRLVLDLSGCFCHDICECRMEAMAVTCFKKGFESQAPKMVEVKGWVAGRPDVDVVVRDCLGIWTMRRAKHVGGSASLALDTISEAEQWLLEVAREEERK